MYEIIYIPNFRKIVRNSMHIINTLIGEVPESKLLLSVHNIFSKYTERILWQFLPYSVW